VLSFKRICQNLQRLSCKYQISAKRCYISALT